MTAKGGGVSAAYYRALTPQWTSRAWINRVAPDGLTLPKPFGPCCRFI
ncbi:MAG TPA: hypothetical protein VGN10_03600 [Pyrinomonadaceae bacterium]